MPDTFKLTHDFVETLTVDGRDVDVVGVFVPGTLDFDYYDLFDADTGECLNLDAPLYEPVTADDVRPFLRTISDPS